MKVSLRAAFAKGLAMFAVVGFSTSADLASGAEPEAPVAIDLQNMVDDHFYHARPSLLSLSGLSFRSPEAVEYLQAGSLAQEVDTYFVATRQAQPNQPLPNQPLPGPNQPLPSGAMASASPVLQTGGLASVDLFAAPSTEAAATQMTPERQQAIQSGSASVVSGAQSQVRATTDAGDLLSKSTSTPGVYVQHRNPIITTPYVRGYGVGQYITQMNGAYWFPARQDLDTALSKVDSASIQDLIVIKGPFSAMYGPGFAFFDVQTKATPRYRNGRCTEFASAMSYNSNGNQWYARQAAAGGGANSGWRIGYGIRTGNDYYVGDAGKPAFAASAGRIPSSYRSQVLDGAFGADLGSDASIETTFLHIDQADLELSGSPFDIDALATNAVTSRIVLTDQAYYDAWTTTVYFNQTRLSGDTARPSKDVQFPGLNGIFTGRTGAEQRSAGYRSALSWGEADWHQLTVGTDLRYTVSELNELDRIPAASPPRSFPIPHTDAVNVGIFQELRVQLTDPWSVRMGGRMDWTHMNAASFVDDDGNGGNDVGGVTSFNYNNATGLGAFGFAGKTPTNSFDLYSTFLTSRYDVTDRINLNASYGYAMRAPTAQELYAREPYVALYQNPLAYVDGNVNLRRERLHQVDVGVDVSGERWRGGVHGFASFIHDYIGTALGTVSAAGSQYGYINYANARLLGAEISNEFDLTEAVTLFGVASYVDGWNHSLKAPMPNIFPLQAYMGVRLHDPSNARRWGVELACRAVQNYNRVGAVDDAFIAGMNPVQVTTSAPGFATGDLRTYYRLTNNASLTSGITNFTDRFYQDPLDARAAGGGGLGASPVGRGLYQPGRSFYFGADFRF